MIFKGICMGAATISMVTVEKNGNDLQLVDTASITHEGELQRTLMNMLPEESRARLSITGRRFRDLLSVPGISEPEAIELAYDFCKKDTAFDAIVSAGSETVILYEVSKEGRIVNVHTGSKCASGTGEFFLQQIERMGLDPEEALNSARGFEPYPVAGRCSVFCKSDCTHALNKGEKKGKVVAGLCKMVAVKIIELVRNTGCNSILLVGGMSKNHLMVDFLRQEVEVVVPEEAPYFEALGAAIWGAYQEVEEVEIKEEALFAPSHSSFSFLPTLEEARDLVTFKKTLKDEAREKDRLLLGLDVGSTTTKAVLLREEDKALVASIYLRTMGDPVQAARNCYTSLAQQVPETVEIIGLGVTGSGRQIAAMHALTEGVINEIIAHATAALYFDPQVDTIFEIGGQDAKYTYIVNGVPADYAMNEACSAGTGSFLEEAARETLEVEMTSIAPRAMKSSSPPNFNDQCAAFIGSDIKTAIQEGISTEDVLGGLVYSICLNYLNRVKGNRPDGQKIFMQGGVCYNKAVPIAMASLLNKEIVVPPEPGLMGAFGVALDISEKINLGLLTENSFNLEELAAREIQYEKPFDCKGDEGCDRRCTINVLRIEGKKYPFGGGCSRYSGISRQPSRKAENLDLVYLREKLLFRQEKVTSPLTSSGQTVGLTPSLMTNSLYPLYFSFFSYLGFEVITPSHPDPAGQQYQGAPFCFPVELAHGYIYELFKHKPDYIFLPQVKGLPASKGNEVSITCPLSQGEPYYLRSAFQQLRDDKKVLTPVLDFSSGYESQEKQFLELARKLGYAGREASRAYRFAVSMQKETLEQFKRYGQELLEELAANPEQKAVILFGRSYNAFSVTANLGIPHKFASRGWKIVPYEFLPFEEEETDKEMYWSSGQAILQAARLIARHPQLFGAFITNFSCGPDSFLIGYFREIMGSKPSLTLELDGHTADAGLDTRIEAFLDIVSSYMQSFLKETPIAEGKMNGRPKALFKKEGTYLQLPDGDLLPLTDPRVKVLIPSMGEQGNPLLSSVMTAQGINSIPLPPPNEKELKLGRANSSCKECLPLQLTVGSLLRYLDENPNNDGEQLVYFMPNASGPCRFGQYQVFINHLLDNQGINNVTTLSLSAENSYGGLSMSFALRAWQGLVIADVMHEIFNTLMVVALDRQAAREAYQEAYNLLNNVLLQGGRWREIKKALERASEILSSIELVSEPAEVPKVALLGEIYVRHDNFSCQGLVEYLASQGIIATVAPINEWIYYCDYLVQKGISPHATLKERWKNRIQWHVKRWFEKEIKQTLAESKLYHYRLTDVEKIMVGGEKLINPRLTGEAILTVSTALDEIIDEVSGAIAIGPFGCMPNRMAEAVAGKTLSQEKPNFSRDEKLTERILTRNPHLPFMVIETDGSVFPQVVQARLESFVLQVKRLHQIIEEEKLLHRH